MLRLEWTTPAADALEAAQTYYHDLNPMAARLLARRIIEAAMRLQQQPQTGSQRGLDAVATHPHPNPSPAAQERG